MIAQTVLVAVLMLVALLAPPASGSILLVPLHAGNGASALHDALAHGARLEGTGPISGSYVVHADRAAIQSAMHHAGVVMLAWHPMLCGEPGALAS